MSGTFQLDNQLFPCDPITKRWTPQQVAVSGLREPIFTNIWRFECSFGILTTQGQSDFFMTRFITGGLYPVVLPHPITGQLVSFTGAAIDAYSFDWNDIDRNAYAVGARLILSVDLRATGTP